MTWPLQLNSTGFLIINSTNECKNNSKWGQKEIWIIFGSKVISMKQLQNNQPLLLVTYWLNYWSLNQKIKDLRVYQISGSNFRTFWLAPITQNFLGYSLFCKRREKWHVVLRKFQKKKLWPLMKRHCFIHLIWWRAVDIYLDALHLSIYPPLFTSPSRDSCILLLSTEMQILKLGNFSFNCIFCSQKGFQN